ncbi:MAG: hypothetical protein AAF585_18040 [Verrucomicrobiota bacterium]
MMLLTRVGKGKLNDWGTPIPFIANWKGKIKPGVIHDDLIDFSDFLPTLIELASAEMPEVPLRWSSFAPRIWGTGSGDRTWVYVEHRGISWTRDRRFKLYSDGRFFFMQIKRENCAANRPGLSPISRLGHRP